MEQKTVRELGGEVWAEITQIQNSTDNNSLLNGIDFKVSQELSDLVMGVLARHTGAIIVNDEDLPVTPLAKTYVGE